MSDNDRELDPERDLLSDKNLAKYRDGGVIRFKPQELPGKHRSKPLTVQWEIEVATGKRGEIVALAQAAAIQEVLDWMATRKSAQGEQPEGQSSSALAKPCRVGSHEGRSSGSE